jgi:hypothetical protein
MTGDQILGMEFPLRIRGYEQTLVRDLLRVLEAGFSPATIAPRPRFARVMWGYDPKAVDRLLDTLLSGSTQETSPLGPTNPWQVAYGEAEPRDSPDAMDPQAWLRVSGLPGMRLRRISGSTSVILGSSGDVLMTGRRRALTLGVGGQVLRCDWEHNQIVDAGTGDPILRWIGSHEGYHRPVVLLPGQRWLRFPVRGSRRRNAVMRAVDESGTEVLWLRKIERTVTEAVVSPNCDLTPEILCVIQLAALWLPAY